MALTFTPAPVENQVCPEFELTSTESKVLTTNDIADGKPFLVMFICNHCPYVKAIEERLIQLAYDLQTLSIKTVAICSNDSSGHSLESQEDSFENLKKRASEKKYPFPYLHDPDQVVAKRFGAVCTPDFFLFDAKKRLQYRGRLDDSWKDPSKVTRRELLLAAQSMIDETPLTFEPLPSMGCSIKWTATGEKKGNS